MYNVCAHNISPKSAVLALGLLKKKKERWILRGWQKCFFGYLALRKRTLAVLKVATNADTTIVNAYTVKSAAWKYETAKKNWRFRQDCLWDAILHDGARFQSILAFL